LRARTEELAQSNENLQRFAYIVAHDLQTPLRTIASMTQLLARRFEGKADQETQELVHLIVSGVERGKRLISDLLDYAQVSEHGSDQSLEPLTPLSWPHGPSPTSRRRSTKPMPA
jgi:light-regulated signal transduction histidine kinase (bacteriophytochrome)